MGYGLAVEGEDGPFAGQRVTPVPTCGVDETVAGARAALESAGDGTVVVVVGGPGLALGTVDAASLAGAGADDDLLDVMAVVPSTVRPSVAASSLGESPVLVTTSDGVLLGAAVSGPPAGHDHEGHDHEGHSPELDQEITETLAAVAEHFGDHEPTGAQLRAFLRDRLIGEGRSPEEADDFLADLIEDQAGS